MRRCQRIRSAIGTASANFLARGSRINACILLQDLVDPNFSHPLLEACILLQDLVERMFSPPLLIYACIPPPGTYKPRGLPYTPRKTVATAKIQGDIATAQWTQLKLYLQAQGAPGPGQNKATTSMRTTTSRHAWTLATILHHLLIKFL